MLVVEDVAVLLGKPLDRDVITGVVGVDGRELPNDHDPGHPEDERHHYIVPSLGLELQAGPDRIVRTAFCMLDGDENVLGFPWTMANGVGPASTRDDVRAKLGQPESSGEGSRFLPNVGAWDRFPFPPFGFLHVQYKRSGNGIAQITLMDAVVAPSGV